MTNPYQTPSIDSEGIVCVRESIPATWLHRIMGRVFFAIGCTSGMNLGVVVDQGFEEAVRRTTVAPLNAIHVFSCVSLFCLTAVGVWKKVRSYLNESYVAPLNARFVAGLFLMMSFYVAVTYLERQFRGTSDMIAAWIVIAVGLAAIFFAVEIEAFCTRFRQTKRVVPAPQPET